MDGVLGNTALFIVVLVAGSCVVAVMAGIFLVLAVIARVRRRTKPAPQTDSRRVSVIP
jgi:hypothetical protein